MTGFFKENKIGIIITIALLVLGSAYYFSAGLGKNMAPTINNDANSVLKSAEFKIAVADGKALKIFASASDDSLARLKSSEGQSVPEKDTLVVGNAEASMMKEEKLFEKTGDALENLFGINTRIGGVLSPTGTIVDDMHFVSKEAYQQLNGEKEVMYIKFTAEGVPKTFYKLAENEKLPMPVAFTQGGYEYYKSYDVAGVKYYPVIIGSKEAAMMKEEKLFEKTGDTIKGFFGKNIAIVGVLQETNTSIDMMHIIPLDKDELQ
jgi:hypothetical protein